MVMLAMMVAAILSFAPAVLAQIDPWEFEVYPYATEGPGVLEMETDNADVANGHSRAGDGTSAGEFRSDGTWYNQYELTYGLTDRIEAAAYLTLALPRGHGYQYAGSKYRLRGRLFDEDVLPLNLGWYLELEWRKTPQFDANELELELRPIIAKDFRRFSLVINPKFEKAIFVGPNKNKGFEFGYANGLYYRWRRYLSPGVEFYGALGLIDDNDPLSAQQHYVFPVMWGSFRNGIGYSVGPGIGLTRGSDRVIVKFNLELEKYVGAIIKSASDQSWFY
jgi:hypothetical protein